CQFPKLKVTGSIPVGCTNKIKGLQAPGCKPFIFSPRAKDGSTMDARRSSHPRRLQTNLFCASKFDIDHRPSTFSGK
ncbi:hypothetical protein, partial [Pseudomonas sp. MWU12-2323]|uniref:hypothetical protein n=1 Tax=Pseudomonas sp. MWU12-2323 TaxID=2651296 RepID=UPI001C49A773